MSTHIFIIMVKCGRWFGALAFWTRKHWQHFLGCRKLNSAWFTAISGRCDWHLAPPPWTIMNLLCQTGRGKLFIWDVIIHCILAHLFLWHLMQCKVLARYVRTFACKIFEITNNIDINFPEWSANMCLGCFVPKPCRWRLWDGSCPRLRGTSLGSILHNDHAVGWGALHGKSRLHTYVFSPHIDMDHEVRQGTRGVTARLSWGEVVRWTCDEAVATFVLFCTCIYTALWSWGGVKPGGNVVITFVFISYSPTLYTVHGVGRAGW